LWEFRHFYFLTVAVSVAEIQTYSSMIIETIPQPNLWLKPDPSLTIEERALRVLYAEANWWSGEIDDDANAKDGPLVQWQMNCPSYPTPGQVAMAAITGDERVIASAESWSATHATRVKNHEIEKVADLDWKDPRLHPDVVRYVNDVFCKEPYGYPRDAQPAKMSAPYAYRVLAKGKPEKLVYFRDGKCWPANPYDVDKDIVHLPWCEESDVQFVRNASGFDF
jgi:hypothetical protein